MPMRVEYTPPKLNAAVAVGLAADLGVNEAAKHLLRVATDRCPKESGRLRDSGEVTDFTGLEAGPGNVHMAAVSYGREDAENADQADTADYCVYQHEVRQLDHHGVGEWGWLIKSMDSERAAMLGLAAEPLRELFGR